MSERFRRRFSADLVVTLQNEYVRRISEDMGDRRRLLGLWLGYKKLTHNLGGLADPAATQSRQQLRSLVLHIRRDQRRAARDNPAQLKNGAVRKFRVAID